MLILYYITVYIYSTILHFTLVLWLKKKKNTLVLWLKKKKKNRIEIKIEI